MGRKVDWSTIPDDGDVSREAEPAQSVIVSDGCLTVRDWQTRDEDIVTFFDGDNLGTLLQRALKVGVLALRSAHVSVGVDIVQREFERLTARLDTSLDARIREMNADLQAVFDPQRGAMSVTLKRYLDQGGTLADFFDPNRRDSARRRPESCGKEKWRILPVVKLTTNAPPCRAATGGMRHGQRYQEAGCSA